MSLGDAAWFRDLILNDTLPHGWFDPDGEVIRAVTSAMASSLALNFEQVRYAAMQTRLATATDAFLDIFAEEYFGRGLMKRRPGEDDTAYRARLKQEVLRPLVTRTALIDAITDLTGYVPEVFEPANGCDTGWLAGQNTQPNNAFTFGHSRLGSRAIPFNFFVRIRRAASAGYPGRSGFNSNPSGIGSGYFYLSSPTTTQDIVSDDEILKMVARVIPAGVTAWVTIKSGV